MAAVDLGAADRPRPELDVQRGDELHPAGQHVRDDDPPGVRRAAAGVAGVADDRHRPGRPSVAIWFAAKIFKVGLLMHGKPPNFATLIRWASSVSCDAKCKADAKASRARVELAVAVDYMSLGRTSGYNYPEWKGSFYPEKLPAAKMLPYYAERFPTVEINYTFYRAPNEKILDGWNGARPSASS